MVDEQQPPAAADDSTPAAEAPATPAVETPAPEAPAAETAAPEAPAAETAAPEAATAAAPAAAAPAPADASPEAMAAAVQARRRRGKRNVPHGQAHIKASFNNTIISIPDQGGAVVAWSSGGSVGFKGSRKSTPYAAQVAAEQAARKAGELGVRKLDVIVSGSGSGRDTAIRTLQNMGIEVTGVKDVTPLPHNGCRPKKRKRG